MFKITSFSVPTTEGHRTFLQLLMLLLPPYDGYRLSNFITNKHLSISRLTEKNLSEKTTNLVDVHNFIRIMIKPCFDFSWEKRQKTQTPLCFSFSEHWWITSLPACLTNLFVSTCPGCTGCKLLYLLFLKMFIEI